MGKMMIACQDWISRAMEGQLHNIHYPLKTRHGQR